jgi:xanthine dehydrogenase accessory factor
VLENFDGCLTALGPDDYVVIVTRGHLHDRDVLAQALRTDAGYIGMIGSRSKRDAVYRSLLESGYTQADLDRVFCPIGLGIGADTPEEIAVSIVGEMIRVRAGVAA